MLLRILIASLAVTSLVICTIPIREGTAPKKEARIINGDVIPDDGFNMQKWPFLVFIEGQIPVYFMYYIPVPHPSLNSFQAYRASFAGAVLNRRWIITCAHTIFKADWHRKKFFGWSIPKEVQTDARNYWVHVGRSDRSIDNLEWWGINGNNRLEKIILHASWTGRFETPVMGDIALLQTQVEIPPNRNPSYGPASLKPRKVALPLPALVPSAGEKGWPVKHTKCYAMGWGCTVRPNKTTPVQLSPVAREAVVEIWTDYCPSYKKQEDRGTTSMKRQELCSGSWTEERGYSGLNGTCQGDSGGPLMCPYQEHEEDPIEWYHAGVLSRGNYRYNDRDEKVHYSLHTRTSYYLKWILNRIKTEDPVTFALDYSEYEDLDEDSADA